MPTREESELRERAETAVRGGRPAEAIAAWETLLGRVAVFDHGVYDAWLDGALTAYRAAGRDGAVAVVLLALGRFAEAERQLDRTRHPVEWALAVGRQGRAREAALALADAGLAATAALDLAADGFHGEARRLWDRVLAEGRLRRRPYEAALAHAAAGRTSKALGDDTRARTHFGEAQRLLDEQASDFEARGQRERAYECYVVLARIGRDAGSFENVAEGAINALRILTSERQRYWVILRHCDDFLREAERRGEHQAAAEVAREAAEYCDRAGLRFGAAYRVRSIEQWTAAAAAHAKAGLAPEMSEAALLQALDAAAGLEDAWLVGRTAAALAALPLGQAAHARYAALVTRHPPPPAVDDARGSRAADGALPERLRGTASDDEDVVRQDLTEWELEGRAAWVLARLIVDPGVHARFRRLALVARLEAESPRAVRGGVEADVALAAALGRVQLYDVLAPLERLFATGALEVRRAVMAAAAQVFCRRSLGLVRSGLGDPDALVRAGAVRALRALRFAEAQEPLRAIFRDSTDPEVRAAVIDTVADIGRFEAGLFLLDVVQDEPGALRELAARRLRSFAEPELWPVMRQRADVAVGEVREALLAILGAAGAA